MNFKELAERFTAQVDDAELARLAAELGVTVAALQAVRIGWASAEDLRLLKASGAGWQEAYPDGAWSFSEVNGAGQIVGFSLRAPDGRKGAPSSTIGAKRGLVVPAGLHASPGIVLIVEGASDVAAAVTLGLVAVGRPSNSSGADDIRALLRKRDCLIVGENDAKDSGAWPGRDGAIAVTQRIANASKEPARFTLPPAGTKDIRSWLQARIAAGLDVNDIETCKAVGAELLASLTSAAEEVEPEGRQSQADRLVELADELFALGRSESDEPFAIRKAGPNVAIMFRGSKDALRSELAREFHRRIGKVPSATALSDALCTLQGMAAECEREEVHLRVARHEDAIVLDLGDAEGSAVIVRPGGWEVVDTSPVLFRRTALTGALPTPERGGSLDELHDILNVSAETWPLLRGWLVAALFPNISHPIVFASGLQGSAKTTGMRYALGLLDATPAPVESQPCDIDRWAVRAMGSWCILLDNVSGFARWFSDCLCKASTGDGLTKRTLFSDSGLTVLAFRRVIAMTSIDAGTLAGDLGERLLVLDFPSIPPGQRRTERELDAEYERIRPRALAGLLDLLATVLARIEDVHLDSMPRMADFARVLAALDGADGASLLAYHAQSGRVSQDVVESDAVATAIVAMVDTTGPFSGTPAELLAKITPEVRAPRGWPDSPRKLAGHLRRCTPALEAVGIRVEYSKGTRRIYKIQRHAPSTVFTVLPSENAADGGDKADSRQTVGENVPSADDVLPSFLADAKDGRLDGQTVAETNRLRENPAGAHENPDFDGADGKDGTPTILSLDDDSADMPEAIAMLRQPDGSWSTAGPDGEVF